MQGFGWEEIICNTKGNLGSNSEPEKLECTEEFGGRGLNQLTTSKRKLSGNLIKR